MLQNSVISNALIDNILNPDRERVELPDYGPSVEEHISENQSEDGNNHEEIDNNCIDIQSMSHISLETERRPIYQVSIRY